MGTDYGQFAWNLWAVDEAISSLRWPLRTDLMFHPQGSSLAAHVLTPGFWPWTAAVKALLGADDRSFPIVAYRSAIGLLYALIVFGTWCALRRMGAAPLAAVAGTLSYAFCSFNQFHAPHLNHLSTAALLPFAAWALVSFHERPRAGPLSALAVLLGTGPYFGELSVFAWASFGAVACAALARRRDRATVPAAWPPPRAFVAAGFLFAACLAPFVLEWTRGEAEPMPSRQAWFWSTNIAGLFVPDPVYQPGVVAALDAVGLGDAARTANARITKGIGGREVFLGYAVVAGVLIALASPRRRFWTVMSIALGAAFLLLSLGPALKIFGWDGDAPMPYRWLALIPPFSMGRTPVRCVLFAIFFFTIAATHGWSDVERRGIRGRVAAALAVVVAAAGTWSPRVPAKPFVSPLDLAQLVPGEVCNIPLSTLDGFAVLLQTQHRRKIVTGLVSRRSAAQARDVNALGDMLDHDPPAFARELLRRNAPNVILGPGAPRHLVEVLPPLGLNVIDLRASGGKMQ